MSDNSPESGSSRSSLESYVVDELLSSPNLKMLEANDQIRELQTIIRDKNTSRGDFVFYSNRLIRLVVEEGLNCLPSFSKAVTTPTGCEYQGEWFNKNNCAVSILRSVFSPVLINRVATRYGMAGARDNPSMFIEECGYHILDSIQEQKGEAMEKGLRDCCRSMRIGKILIRRDHDTHIPKVYYAKFPPSIETRKILLLIPILESGATVCRALEVLKEHGANETNIFLVTLFATPRGTKRCLDSFPDITMLTSEIHEQSPSHFGSKYFGSD